MDTERLVGVQRSTSGLGVLRDQFEVGEGGQRRDNKREQKRQPDDAADRAGHGSGDGVHTGAEDVTNNEQEQKLGSQDPLEFGFVTSRSCVEHFVLGCAHG